jgi:hypothetical protein
MTTTTSETALARAEESVSARFTRIMNATTSRWGLLTDPAIVGVCTAPPLVALIAAMRLDAAAAVVTGLEVLTAAPLTAAVLLALALRGARARVIAWLAGLPFPLENLNAVLNGLGEVLEVTFRDASPSAREVNELLDPVSAESFVTEAASKDGEPASIEVRIGVVDDKRNPAASNHRRFERVRALVEEVLVPLGTRYPIAGVRVK